MAESAIRPLDDDKAGASVEGLAAEASHIAGDIKSAAVQQGKQLLDDVKDQATSFADARKNEAASSVSGIASSLRETGKTFEQRPAIQALMGSAADGLEQFASDLQNRSFAEIYGEAEDYARRSPLVVGAAAAAAGFLLARFIKSSSDDMSTNAAVARERVARRASSVRPV